MKTILISISLLFLSILLVVGCEVIDKNLQEDSQLETEFIQQTSGVKEAATLQNNTELTDFEDDNKGKLQKTDDS